MSDDKGIVCISVDFCFDLDDYEYEGLSVDESIKKILNDDELFENTYDYREVTKVLFEDLIELDVEALMKK